MNMKLFLLGCLTMLLPWLALVQAEVRADLEAVEFWNTAEFKQARSRTEGIRGLDAKTLEARRVEITPRVQRILDDSATCLSLLLAPGVLPEGFERDLIPLHSERIDKVRLPRFLHKDWILESTVTSNSMDVTAYRYRKERVTGGEELRQMVLALANELLVSDETVISSVTLSGNTQTNAYGLGGFLDPARRHNLTHVSLTSDGTKLADWPQIMGFQTDGKTISIGILKPHGPRLVEGIGVRARSDWFAGTEAERAAEARRATE